MVELSSLTSRELVELALGRGPEAKAAWDLLVSQYVQLVWKRIRSFDLPAEAAWDAFQSTWLRAIERLHTLQDPDCFPGWLATIARNETHAVIRTRNKQVPMPDGPEPRPDETPVDEPLQRHQLVAAVRDGFGCLSPQCRELLRLLSADPPVAYQEIARLLDMPHGSIGPTRRRCLEKLRETPALLALVNVEP